VQGVAACRRALSERPTVRYGGQERSVPDVKGCIPDAPRGGHNTHAGTLLDGADVAVAEDPPAPPRDDELDTAPVPLDRAPVVPPTVDVVPADELPNVEPVAVVEAAAPAVDCTVVAGLADVVVALVAALPRVTTPLLVILPGWATVCAEAGAAIASENSTA
jgi:hypothetical protein